MCCPEHKLHLPLLVRVGRMFPIHLQFAKMESYEGSVRTPLIAFWPKGISVKKGSISDRTGHVMDFMATFIELANAKYPATYKGNTIKPLQGTSFTTAFVSKNAQGHQALFNEHLGAKYARYEE